MGTTSGDRAYARAGAIQSAFNLLHAIFEESGLTISDLAEQSGFDEEIIKAVLTRPRDMELGFLASLLASMTSGRLLLTLQKPSQQVNIGE